MNAVEQNALVCILNEIKEMRSEMMTMFSELENLKYFEMMNDDDLWTERNRTEEKRKDKSKGERNRQYLKPQNPKKYRANNSLLSCTKPEIGYGGSSISREFKNQTEYVFFATVK